MEKIIMVDYIPAELRIGKYWEIVFYAYNPLENKLARKRIRVRKMASASERRNHAKRMIHDINKKLERGWNPFLEGTKSRQNYLFTYGLNSFLTRYQKETKDGNIRPDTLRSYTHMIQSIKTYMERQGIEEMLSFKFDHDFVGEYLDYIRYGKGLSAKTRDNHLSFLKTLSTFLISKKYIVVNPTKLFSTINKKKKTRTVINKHDRELIFDYWKERDEGYLMMCLICYYCLVRRTEITRLKVHNINLKNSTLFISSDQSKNRKDNHVTIPDQIKKRLKKYLAGSDPNHFLVSNDFKPGTEKLRPNKITKRWSYMRKKLGLPSNIHWYSLKDSGITDLLRSGVPLISVRDQARHSTSAQTDAYTPKDIIKADDKIKKSDIRFEER